MTQPATQGNIPTPATASSIRTCPHCGTAVQTGGELAGFDVQCPMCGQVVPAEAQPADVAQPRKRMHPDAFAGWGVSTMVHFLLVLSLAGVTWLSDADGRKVPDEKPVGLVADDDKGASIDKEPPKEIELQGTTAEFKAPSFTEKVSTTPIANVMAGTSPAPSGVDAVIGLDMASGGTSSAAMQGDWSAFATGGGTGGEGMGWDSFVSVGQLIEAIMDYIAHHNENPRTFVWTAKVEDILAKIARARAVLNNVQSD